MKKIFIVASFATFAGCNSGNDTSKVDSMGTGKDSTATMRDINSPYAIGYSSKFVMDDPKNAESVLNLWKIWDSGDLSASKDLFADSVTLHLADGSMMHGLRDSIVAGAQRFRSSLAKSVSSVDAVMAVKSTDKNENWALIWGKEVDTDKKGKVDSFYSQETWGFNKDGKVNLLYQFRASGTPPKK
jgi:ketosteroid isomerase-like protein